MAVVLKRWIAFRDITIILPSNDCDTRKACHKGL